MRIDAIGYFCEKVPGYTVAGRNIRVRSTEKECFACTVRYAAARDVRMRCKEKKCFACTVRYAVARDIRMLCIQKEAA